MTQDQSNEAGECNQNQSDMAEAGAGQPDLLIAAAENRVFGSLVEVRHDLGHGQVDPLTGEQACRRIYSNALLSMLTKANRPDQFGRTHKAKTEAIWHDIASDLDPPHVLRGRVA